MLTAALRLIRGEVIERPVLASWTQVLDYCRASMGFEGKEQFRILFLVKRNQIIADEVQQKGTVDHTPVYVREVVKRALELSSTAIVLVHNHPSGDPTPSRADIEMTRQIIAAAKPLGVIVHDHIIVGKQGHASFRGARADLGQGEANSQHLASQPWARTSATAAAKSAVAAFGGSVRSPTR